ncbi:MAG: n-acetylglutamate synthase [Pseudomonadota bacterium]
MIHYGDRLFRPVATDGGGDVGGDTLFRYDQRGDVLIASYSGGAVEYGSIVGTVHPDGSLTFLYQHVTKDGALRAGRCQSRPEVLPTGRIRLHESWEWTSGLGAGERGTSVLEEV